MNMFNQTFTADKPIYYPSNWGTGKTAFDIYEEWKLTITYSILSNLIQCLLACLWLFLIYVVCNAAKEIWRIYNLAEDNRQKIQKKRYIDNSFIMGISFLGSILLLVTVSLLIIDETTKFSLLKGILGWILILGVNKIYKMLRIAKENSNSRHQYEKLKKQQEQ